MENRPERCPKANIRGWLDRGALFVSGAVAASAGFVGWHFASDNSSGSQTTPAVAGEITCPPSEPFEGAWLEASDDNDSGWVNWKPNKAQPNVAAFTSGLGYAASRFYVLRVGCGGDADNWTHNDESPAIVVSPELIMVHCIDTSGTKAGTCTVSES